jgi:hypothetical protein
MRLFIGFHALLALALAAVQRTWLEAIVVIGLSVLLSRLPAQRRPGSFFARAGGGIALQLFAALHVVSGAGPASSCVSLPTGGGDAGDLRRLEVSTGPLGC